MEKDSKRPTPPPLPSPFPVQRTKLSLDNDEPRTLDEDELHFAREAALEVLRTRTEEEAKKIFLQERQGRKEERLDEEDDQDYVIVEFQDLSTSEEP